MSKVEGKKDVTMLTTIHEAVMVEMGKCDALGEKIEKPEAVYYYCSRMGGVDLSDQLLHYFSFLRKSMKWSRKLLIHMFNMVILNVYILNKYYGCEKLSHDECRDKIVKYLLEEGLKIYNIPLPPVISRRIGKYHKAEHDNCVNGIFLLTSPIGRAEKGRNFQGVVSFVVKSLGRN